MEKLAPLVLASSSKRRLELLTTIGRIPSKIIASDIDESPFKGELPYELASRLSIAKATKVALENKKCFILGADRVVACGRKVLPKTNTMDEARMCLELLSGRRHSVWGGVAIISPTGKLWNVLIMTRVQFKRLS